MRRTFINSTLAAAIVFALHVPVWAQEDEGGDPQHGAARISLIEGNVSVAHGDSGEMTGAAMNAPLVTGDRILTGENSRAEVQFDANNLIRLAPGTEVRIGDLQYRHYVIQVAQGTATFRQLRDSDAQIEISTPSVSIRPLRQGTYRVAVFGTSEITVRQGEAEAFSPSGSEPLHEGQTMLSRGPANDPEFMTEAAIPYDDWDRWNTDRDRVFERASASRYTSPDIYGTESLDNNGRWNQDPEYGWGWTPNEPADWAPYQQGRWVWVDYYGWTWVSYDPWGWAPYHYGRWYRGAFGWTWYPGPIVPRYYWRPALVGFFGWGSPSFGVSFGFGYGNVGWVPLAPREVFRPWYGRSNFYVTNVNVINTYHNARFINSVTSVRAGEFGRAGIRGNGFVHASNSDLSRAGMMQGRMPFGVPRESRQFSDRAFSTQGMPRTNAGTRFYSTMQARQSGIAPQSGFQNNGGWRRLDTQRSDTQRFDTQNSPRGFSSPGSGSPGFSRAPQSPAPQAPAQQNFNAREGFRGFSNNAPRERQPIEIRPPIVSNRNEGGFGRPFNNAPNNSAPSEMRSHEAPRNNFHGGFGGPRPQYGGDGAGFSAPRGNSGGGGGGFNGPRGNPGGGFSGGAPHGGGGGGGHSNGGSGGHSGGHGGRR